MYKTKKHTLISIYVFVYIFKIYIHTYFISLQLPNPKGFKSEEPCVYMHYKERYQSIQTRLCDK